MKRITIFLSLCMLLIALPLSAQTTWTVDDNKVECPTANFTHPQDAVNAASPGDTIKIYPGTYESRVYTTKPPHYSLNDQYAPALIVYKDDLIIEAADSYNASQIIIQSTHNYWSNPVAIQASTGGTWDGTKYVGAGVNPTGGSAPNAVSVIASNVTIRGFTLRKPNMGDWGGFWNSAGVMIGGLYAGDPYHLGSDDNTVEKCVFSDVWHAVYIWHSSDNVIEDNLIQPLGTGTGHWAAISAYDGYNDAQINLGHPSENNFIAHNTISDKGISLGAWAPPTWTSNAGSQVCCNITTQVGVGYSHGPVIVGCNTVDSAASVFWQSNTDKVIQINGITYTGATSILWTSDTITVNLPAQLSYAGSADGSGVAVVFKVDGTDYLATTIPGCTASTTANLEPGVYTIKTSVTFCDSCCHFEDTDPLIIGQYINIDIKPGSYPNSINLKSKGKTPVAILTTPLFDASTVNPVTVEFAGARPPVHWSLEDVDGDGDIDMILHFDTQALKLSESSTDATLTGNTTDGTPIKDTDSVNIVHEKD